MSLSRCTARERVLSDSDFEPGIRFEEVHVGTANVASVNQGKGHKLAERAGDNVKTIL
jgi:hypothetical protein